MVKSRVQPQPWLFFPRIGEITYLAKGIVPAPRFIPIVKVCDIYSLEIFWETDALMPEDAYNVQRAPDGTLLAESVTPIEVYVDLSDNQYNWEA